MCLGLVLYSYGGTGHSIAIARLVGKNVTICLVAKLPIHIYINAFAYNISHNDNQFLYVHGFTSLIKKKNTIQNSLFHHDSSRKIVIRQKELLFLYQHR